MQHFISSLLLGLTVLCLQSCSVNKTKDQKPNIIFILADDLGYGELGCYGQTKIETPHIDQLAKEGMLFTQHYAGAPVCAPSRCVLLTGQHSGHAYIRGNDEWGSRGKVWDYKAMIADSTLEGQRPMPENTPTIASLLKKAGYKTGMVGKWGLGAPHTHSLPTTMGFDFFCGYNCQRQAHTYYPVHLYKNEKRIYLGNDTVAPTTKFDNGADPLSEESYAKFRLKKYAPDAMFDEMMHFIENSKDDPFFMYWASPIPHVPLQAPQKWVDYYVDKFGEEEPYVGNKGYFPNRHPHATYAAMVSYLDERVGQLVSKLKANDQYDNTLIIFTSDNGPSYAGGADSPWFSSAGAFSTHAKKIKGSVYEGGLRVPMIACWPNSIKAGSQSEHISAFWDFLPTFCEMAEIEATENTDGISLLPTFTGNTKQKKHDYLYWEFPASGGQQAVRTGKWKGIRTDIKNGNMLIELYNLETGEEKNVAEEHPEIVKQMEEIMQSARNTPEIDRFKFKQLGDK